MSFLAGAIARLDSWASMVTGLGSITDKTNTYLPQRDLLLDTDTLEILFSSNDFASRICSALPDRALKQGFGLTSQSGDLEPEDAADQAEELLEACEGFRVQEKFREAMTWGRTYGLGAVLLGVEGSGAPDKPLDDEKATKLLYLMVLDRREITPYTWYTEPLSDNYGEVETYRITPDSTDGNYVGSVVHESRVIRFGGALTSRRERRRNFGCDCSVLQRVFTVLQQTEQNWNGICHLMSDISQGVFAIKDLMDMLATGNEDLLSKRMANVQIGRSVARAIVIDADNEKFERVQTPLAGVPEILEQTWKRLAAAAEMPLTVLMGVSPAGMNATGESDMRLWYDSVQAQREHVLAPAIERVVKLISRTLDHGEPNSWRVTWPSLWQMTAPERAKHMFEVAQADKIYIDSGVLLPEEVALSRFRGEAFNADHVAIDAEAREAALKNAIDELLNPPTPPQPMLPGGGGGKGGTVVKAGIGKPDNSELLKPELSSDKQRSNAK